GRRVRNGIGRLEEGDGIFDAGDKAGRVHLERPVTRREIQGETVRTLGLETAWWPETSERKRLGLFHEGSGRVKALAPGQARVEIGTGARAGTDTEGHGG